MRAATLACALLLGCAAAGAVDGAASAPHPFRPAGELDRLAYLGRAQPDVAVEQLLHFVDAQPVDDPTHLEALLELGAEYVALNRAEAVELTAARIERLSDRLPLARPAAMLLRGLWMESHNEAGKAGRQLIEAAALLPASAPAFLRRRMLVAAGQVDSRGGRYDEAMRRFDLARKMVDEDGPAYLRIDLRLMICNLLVDTGQMEKAAEVTRDLMRLATDMGDEVGLSRTYTGRAIQDSMAGSDALADWRAALLHARLGGNKHQVIVGMANIADYYLEHGDYATAYDLAQKALPLARESDDLPAQSVAYANTGLALIAMRRKAEGMPLVRQSQAIDERSGSIAGLAETSRELGFYLERAGYLEDALSAYHQYRQLFDEVNRQDRQRALIELQESLANEARQHELDMLGRESHLKDEQLLHHALQVRQWTAAGAASLLLLAVLAMLARRLRTRNAQLTASNEQLRLQAEIDPLTGLSNRHHLQAVLARAPGPGLAGALYLLDVDHFKQINDRFGHAGGDAVLVELARRLRRVLRDDDLVVRWGGEEFLVLVRPLPEAEAEALARRLLAAIADTPVAHAGGAVPVTASIGYGLFPLRRAPARPELAVDWERAISVVDAAMYLAKAHGRNGACLVRSVDADGDTIAQVTQHLQQAAAQGRVELRFQTGPLAQEAAA